MTIDISEQRSTTLFHDRIEPLMEVYEDDYEAFGRLMYALLSYSIYGDIMTLKDKRENADLKVLRNMVDLGRESTRDYRVNQTIKSNMKYAESESDMQKRLEMKGLEPEEVQRGIDMYRQKQMRDLGIKSADKDGQLHDWDEYKRLERLGRL